MPDHAPIVQQQELAPLTENAAAAYKEAGQLLQGRQILPEMRPVHGNSCELIVGISRRDNVLSVQVRPVRGTEVSSKLTGEMLKRMDLAPSAEAGPQTSNAELEYDLTGYPGITLTTVGLRGGDTVLNVTPGVFRGQNIEFPLKQASSADAVLIGPKSGFAEWSGKTTTFQSIDREIAVTLREVDGRVEVSAHSGAQQAGTLWYAFIDRQGAVIEGVRFDPSESSDQQKGRAQGALDLEHLSREVDDRHFEVALGAILVFAFQPES